MLLHSRLLRRVHAGHGNKGGRPSHSGVDRFFFLSPAAAPPFGGEI